MTDKDTYLRGIGNRESKAWECFYADYYAALCSYARRLLDDADEAEDVVQDTLVKVWRSGRTFESMTELSWYAYKAVYTNSVCVIRTRRLHDELLKKNIDALTDMPDEHFAMTVREELVRQLRKCINDLPAEARKILELSLDGLSGGEIAATLGISIHTVKSQKNRSLKVLREKMKGAFFLVFA